MFLTSRVSTACFGQFHLPFARVLVTGVFAFATAHPCCQGWQTIVFALLSRTGSRRLLKGGNDHIDYGFPVLLFASQHRQNYYKTPLVKNLGLTPRPLGVGSWLLHVTAAQCAKARLTSFSLELGARRTLLIMVFIITKSRALAQYSASPGYTAPPASLAKPRARLTKALFCLNDSAAPPRDLTVMSPIDDYKYYRHRLPADSYYYRKE